MIAIPITPQAYEAIRATLPETDDAPPKGADGMIRVWLDRRFVDRLKALRGPGESYSDVILRLAKGGSGFLPIDRGQERDDTTATTRRAESVQRKGANS